MKSLTAMKSVVHTYVIDGDWKLIVITQASYVGMLPHGGDVYCVDRIGILPLASYFDFSADVIGLKVLLITEVLIFNDLFIIHNYYVLWPLGF